MVRSVPTVPLARFRKMVRDLLEKTKAGQVNWIRNPAKSQIPETSYAVILLQSRIVLTYTIPRAAPDCISLELQNEEGVAVDSWVLEEPDFDPEHEDLDAADPDGDWRLLYGLFSEVHRRMTGWDKVVSEVEKAISESSPIGNRPVLPRSTNER